MPLYEYKCRECGAEFEFLARIASDRENLCCPECRGNDLEKRFSSPAGIRTGSIREAGQTCCGRDSRCDTPPCSQGNGCRRD